MLDRAISVLAIFFVLNTASCQSNYTFPEKFNSAAYFFDPVGAHKELLKRPEAKNDKQAFDSYLIGSVYAQQYAFDNNEVYLDWNEMESYLKKVLDTLVSEQNAGNLDVFIVRSEEFNASMDRFGIMNVNIGLLAQAENEAELATIMGHETGHYLLRHVTKSTNEYNILLDYKGSMDIASMDLWYRNKRKRESQADSFAYKCAGRCGYSLSAMLKTHEKRDMWYRLNVNQVPYSGLKRISQMPDEELVRINNKNSSAFAGHPLGVERYLKCRWALTQNKKPVKNFLIDSVQFCKLKKIAREERKRITFDKCEYRACAEFCFIDYLHEPKKLKNMYMLCESLRRLVYAKPDMAKLPFLAEYHHDKGLYDYNKSILHKPDYLFEDYEEFEALKGDPLFTSEKKPFNTYEEAFLYFSGEALKVNLNEARLGLGLHYFGKSRMDSAKKYLELYVGNGTGLYIDLAKDLLDDQTFSSADQKTLVVYNNTENYSGEEYNYYYTLLRKAENDNVRKIFGEMKSGFDLVFMNELMGTKPRKLFEYQRMMRSIFSLYSDEEIDGVAKYALVLKDRKQTPSAIRTARKSVLLYAPEWYNWLKQEGYGKLYFTNVTYKFYNYFSDDDYEDNYTAFYLDLNSLKPSFKEPKRKNNKQTDEEIAKDLFYFLNGN